jgi:hypothetical protein
LSIKSHSLSGKLVESPFGEKLFKVDRELEIQVTQSFESPYTGALMKKKADGQVDQNFSEHEKFLHLQRFGNAKIRGGSSSGSQKETFIETVSTSKNNNGSVTGNEQNRTAKDSIENEIRSGTEVAQGWLDTNFSEMVLAKSLRNLSTHVIDMQQTKSHDNYGQLYESAEENHIVGPPKDSIEVFEPDAANFQTKKVLKKEEKYRSSPANCFKSFNPNYQNLETFENDAESQNADNRDSARFQGFCMEPAQQDWLPTPGETASRYRDFFKAGDVGLAIDGLKQEFLTTTDANLSGPNCGADRKAGNGKSKTPVKGFGICRTPKKTPLKGSGIRSSRSPG